MLSDVQKGILLGIISLILETTSSYLIQESANDAPFFSILLGMVFLAPLLIPAYWLHYKQKKYHQNRSSFYDKGAGAAAVVVEKGEKKDTDSVSLSEAFGLKASFGFVQKCRLVWVKSSIYGILYFAESYTEAHSLARLPVSMVKILTNTSSVITCVFESISPRISWMIKRSLKKKRSSSEPNPEHADKSESKGNMNAALDVKPDLLFTKFKVIGIFASFLGIIVLALDEIVSGPKEPHKSESSQDTTDDAIGMVMGILSALINAFYSVLYDQWTNKKPNINAKKVDDGNFEFDNQQLENQHQLQETKSNITVKTTMTGSEKTRKNSLSSSKSNLSSSSSSSIETLETLSSSEALKESSFVTLNESSLETSSPSPSPSPSSSPLFAMCLFVGLAGLFTILVLTPVWAILLGLKIERLDKMEPKDYGWLIVNGLFCYLPSVFMWSRAVSYAGAGIVAMTSSLEIPLTLVIDIIKGGEKISILRFVSAGLMMLGFMLISVLDQMFPS